jgi:hypothetical protein
MLNWVDRRQSIGPLICVLRPDGVMEVCPNEVVGTEQIEPSLHCSLPLFASEMDGAKDATDAA